MLFVMRPVSEPWAVDTRSPDLRWCPTNFIFAESLRKSTDENSWLAIINHAGACYYRCLKLCGAKDRKKWLRGLQKAKRTCTTCAGIHTFTIHLPYIHSSLYFFMGFSEFRRHFLTRHYNSPSTPLLWHGLAMSCTRTENDVEQWSSGA